MSITQFSAPASGGVILGPESSILTHATFGDFGAAEVVLAVQTTSATTAVIGQLTLDDNSLYFFDAYIIARGASGRAYYERSVRCHRQGGGGATLGTVDFITTDESVGAVSWNATYATSSNDIQITVQGAAGVTIEWLAKVTVGKVS